MTFTAPSVGALRQFGLDSVNPITAAYEYNSFDLQSRPTFVETDGNRGILDHIAETVAASIIPCNGPIELVPTPAILSTILLKAILGGTPTGSGPTTYPLGSTLPQNYYTIDRGGTVETYAAGTINRATFSGSEGTQLRMGLDVVATTETVGSSGTFPGSLTPPREAPFMFTTATFTLNSVARQVREVTITIENHLNQRFVNSQTIAANSLVPLDRVISIDLLLPYTLGAENDDLRSLAVNSAATGSVAFTNGTKTLTFTFGTIQVDGPPTYPIQGKNEIFMRVPLKARQIGSGPTPALSVTM